MDVPSEKKNCAGQREETQCNNDLESELSSAMFSFEPCNFESFYPETEAKVGYEESLGINPSKQEIEVMNHAYEYEPIPIRTPNASPNPESDMKRKRNSKYYQGPNAALDVPKPTLYENPNCARHPTEFSVYVPNDQRKRARQSDKKKLTYLNFSGQPTPRRRKKKPNGMPKRPLSAYNLFFQAERVKILGSVPDDGFDESRNADESCANWASELFDKWPDPEPEDDSKKKPAEVISGNKRRPPHGKIGFEDLGKVIGVRWQSLSPEEKKKFQLLADEDSERYRREMSEFYKNKNQDDGKARRLSDADKNEMKNISAFEVPKTKIKTVDQDDSKKQPFISMQQVQTPLNNYITHWLPRSKSLKKPNDENISSPKKEQSLGINSTDTVTIDSWDTITINDGNESKQYRLAYAVVPMSPETASKFMENSVTCESANKSPQKP